jgi:hypothetical protein
VIDGSLPEARLLDKQGASLNPRKSLDYKAKNIECCPLSAVPNTLYDWLAETEDQVDQLSDQIEALRKLLEEAAALLDGAGVYRTMHN